MNELTVFTNEEFGNVRMIEFNGEPYFVGKDVADALGYSNSRDAIATKVDDEDKISNVAIHDGRQNRKMTIVNESGMYSLIFGSKLSTAKQFKHWVTSEVLPNIRKNGYYVNDSLAMEAIKSLIDPILGELKETNKDITDRLSSLEAQNTAVIDRVAFKDSDKKWVIKRIKSYLNIKKISEDYYEYNRMRDLYMFKCSKAFNMPINKLEDIPKCEKSINILHEVLSENHPKKHKYPILDMIAKLDAENKNEEE